MSNQDRIEQLRADIAEQEGFIEEVLAECRRYGAMSQTRGDYADRQADRCSDSADMYRETVQRLRRELYDLEHGS